MKAIEQAPDAVRERFVAWRKAQSSAGTTEQNQFALAMSGFVAGSDAATHRPEDCRDPLAGSRPGARATWPERRRPVARTSWRQARGAGMARRWRRCAGAPQARAGHADRAAHAPAPARPSAAAEKTILHKLEDDQNEAPTEYAVLLPPEYHPLRSYPAIVALHSGPGPQSAIEVWAAEAARRGYIVIAPDYSVPGQPADYRYTPSEHAAAELALRDARKRYAIDSDRVFVAGQLSGGKHGLGPGPGPSRPVRRGHRDLRLSGQVRSPLPAASRAPAALLRDRRPRPGRQRGDLTAAM